MAAAVPEGAWQWAAVAEAEAPQRSPWGLGHAGPLTVSTEIVVRRGLPVVVQPVAVSTETVVHDRTTRRRAVSKETLVQGPVEMEVHTRLIAVAGVC